jgi:hypothetical protein
LIARGKEPSAPRVDFVRMRVTTVSTTLAVAAFGLLAFPDRFGPGELPYSYHAYGSSYAAMTSVRRARLAFEQRWERTVELRTMVGWETPLEISSSRADITHSIPPETPAPTETAKANEPAPDVPIDLVCDTLADAAAESELPVAFFARLIWQESGFRQRIVSRAGAQGVAQFMPKTAEYVGLEDPFDPLEALPASARFLQSLHRYFGNLGLAAAAYNAGPRRIQNWLAKRGPLPQETRQYVRKITGQEPEKWLEQKPVEIAVHLPNRAPCEGIAGLSRDFETRTVPAFLTEPVARLIEEAKLAAERARQVKERLLAARRAKASKASVAVAAKAKGIRAAAAKAKPAAQKSGSYKLAEARR